MYKNSYRLLYQHVYIRDYDFKSHFISAATKLTFEPLQDDIQFIKLNCRQCQIRKVEARIADTLVSNAEQRSGAQSVSLECAISYNDPTMCFEPLLAVNESDETVSGEQFDLSLAEAALSDAQRETSAESGGGELTVRLPGLLQQLIRERRIRFFTIRIEYTLERPQAGIRFQSAPGRLADDDGGEADNGVYEALFTGRPGETRFWLPCVDADAAVCLWRFEIAVRAADGHVPIAPGAFAGVSRTRQPVSSFALALARRGTEPDGDRLLYTFTLRTPTAACNVGFAIGTFDCAVVRQPDAPRADGEETAQAAVRTSSNEPFETHVYYPRVLRDLVSKALRVRLADTRRVDDDCLATATATCPFAAADRLLASAASCESGVHSRSVPDAAPNYDDLSLPTPSFENPESSGQPRGADSNLRHAARFRARHTHVRSSDCVFFELFGVLVDQLGVADRMPFNAFRCVFLLGTTPVAADCSFASLALLDAAGGALQNETLPEAAVGARRALVQCVAAQFFGVLVASASFSARWLINGLAAHLAASFLADAQHRRTASTLRTGANEERWRAARCELDAVAAYERTRCPVVLDPRRFLDGVASRVVLDARARRQSSLLRCALSRTPRIPAARSDPPASNEHPPGIELLEDDEPFNKRKRPDDPSDDAVPRPRSRKKPADPDADDDVRNDRDSSSRAAELRRWFAVTRLRRTFDWFTDGAQTGTYCRIRTLKAKLAIAVLEQRLGRDAFRDVLAKLLGAALDASTRTHLRSAAPRRATQLDDDTDPDFGWQPMLLSTDSFIRLVRKVVGKDITDWVDSVAAQPGLARLTITYVHNRKRDSVELEVRQAGVVGSSEPVTVHARFGGPLSVLVQEMDGPFVHTVTVRDSDKATRTELRLHSRAGATSSKRDRAAQPSSLGSRRVALASGGEVDVDLQATTAAAAFLVDAYPDPSAPLTRVDAQPGAVLWLRVIDADRSLLGRVRIRQPVSALMVVAAHERDALAQVDAVEQLEAAAFGLLQLAAAPPSAPPPAATSAFADATGTPSSSSNDAQREQAANACAALRRCLFDVVDSERNYHRVRARAFDALVTVCNRADPAASKAASAQLLGTFKRFFVPPNVPRPVNLASYFLAKSLSVSLARLRDRSAPASGGAARCPSDVIHLLVAALQSLSNAAPRASAPFAGVNDSLLRAAIIDALGYSVTPCAVRIERAAQLPSDVRLVVSEVTRTLNIDYRVAVGSYRFAVTCACLSTLRAFEKNGYVPPPSPLPDSCLATANDDPMQRNAAECDSDGETSLLPPPDPATERRRTAWHAKHAMRFYLDHAEPLNFLDVRLTALRILLDYVQTDRDAECFDWLLDLVERERSAAVRCAIVEEMVRRPPFTHSRASRAADEPEGGTFRSFYVDPCNLSCGDQSPISVMPPPDVEVRRAEAAWRRRVRARLWNWIISIHFHADASTRSAAVELFYVLFGMRRRRLHADDDYVSHATWNKSTADYDANVPSYDARANEEAAGSRVAQRDARYDDDRLDEAAASASESDSESDTRRRHSSHRKHRSSSSRKHHRHRRHKRRRHRSRSRSPSGSQSRSAPRKAPRTDS